MGQVKPFIRINRREAIWAINILTLGLILPFIGNLPLFDWDELNFAEIAREMLVTGDYLLPQVGFSPFWEKPPLFFWMQAACMKIFGVNEFAARLPNTFAALATVNFLFLIGEKIRTWRFGVLWAAIYMGSILPSLYFKSGIIDPWFNLFMFASVYCIYAGLDQYANKWKYIVLAAFLSGLAVLTKGPVGWLIPGAIAFFMLVWDYSRFYNLWQILLGLFVTILTTFLWFGIDLIQNGSWFISTFVEYQIRLFSTEDAGHGGFPGYHVIVLLFGCFPASFFAINEMKFSRLRDRLLSFEVISFLSIIFIIVLFTLVQSKIVHYSSYAYFPITYLAATYLFKKTNWPRWLKISNVIILILLFLVAWIMAIFNQEIINYIASQSTNPEVLATLKTYVAWSPLRYLSAILLSLILVGVVYYKGKPPIYPYLLSMAILTQLFIYAYTGTVNQYAYQPAINFYQEFQNEDAYIYTYGYKTYADKFYGQLDKSQILNTSQNPLTVPIDKKMYIISKNTDKKKLLSHPDIKLLGEDRHYAFFLRSPQAKND